MVKYKGMTNHKNLVKDSQDRLRELLIYSNYRNYKSEPFLLGFSYSLSRLHYVDNCRLGPWSWRVENLETGK